MRAAKIKQERRNAPLAVLATCVAGLAIGLELAPAIRAAIVVPYLLFVPGYMLIQVVRPGMGRLIYPMAVAVSASLIVISGLVQAYAGAWAPPLTMAIAMTVTLIAVGITAVMGQAKVCTGTTKGNQDG